VKVSIIGAGNVGSTLAFKILEEELAEVILVDIKEDLAKAKALDLQDAMAVLGKSGKVCGTDDYKKIKNSKVVVVTAGIPRKPGISREDLLLANSNIVKEVAQKIKENAPGSIILMVTNPLDVMTHLSYKVSGFSKGKVLGMAGVLDSARLSVVLAKALNKEISSIDLLILGTHGDSMVPARSKITINRRPLEEFATEKEIKKAFEDARNQGTKIVSLLKGGSAYYAPALSIYKMIEAILFDKGEELVASCYLEGEYGLTDVCLGVPVRLGKDGIKEIVEINLNPKEKTALAEAAQIIKSNISKAMSLI
jgi:malate dehydrogenase